MRILLSLFVLLLPFIRAAGQVEKTVLTDWEFQKDGLGPFVKVRVPHDWAISGEFDPDATRYPEAKLLCGYAFTGKLPWRGTGRYRRTICVSPATMDRIAAGGRLTLEFDGVMANPEVRVNGRQVGGWDYGYMGFSADASDVVHSGTNLVEVFATTMWHGARWHPGGGIYREARLVIADRNRALPGSLQVLADLAHDRSSAVVKVAYETVDGPTNFSFAVSHPHLWTTDDPHLYELDIAGERFRYGIRTIAWTRDDGFHLNGQRLQIKGVNLHADLGPLGMAFDTDAARRQLAIMKDMGVNAVRTSHNPPAPQFLDLCDEMGFVVWDEGFDKWNDLSGRRPDQNLEEYVSRNMSALVRRDRNHPCVVAWSIGNEIPPASEKYPEGMTRARCAQFREVVRKDDVTRPVAAGCDHTGYFEAANDALEPLDLIGWNYSRKYVRGRKRYLDKPVVCSESASAFSSYGYYGALPSDKGDLACAVREVSSYDHTAAPWSDIPDWEFERMEQDRYCAGEFVWTGVDYLGEPTPYAHLYDKFYPELAKIPERELGRSSYFGAVDLCGIPKDRFYLYRSWWNERSETVHVLPHWTWPGREGRVIPVFVYTSGDEAELFLNGRSLGRRRKREGRFPVDFVRETRRFGDSRTNGYYAVCAKYRLRWLDVPYEPGGIRAVAYRAGRPIGETRMRTAGRPVAVRLTRDPYQRPHDRTVFVQVDLVDAKGVRDPRATDRVRFALRGPGEIVAVGNGNARGADSFGQTDSHPLYFGKAVVVVRLEGDLPATLTASVPGLAEGEIVLRREKETR